ncbi:hypothetical protein [Burkholderia contaminans]|uniref:hypothetical protein n=1 Tax=Burkholderia contaminans TaxID=488447 RepID=UPI00158B7486|nr:hypothetical protein [Burkholderia contaminans]
MQNSLSEDPITTREIASMLYAYAWYIEADLCRANATGCEGETSLTEARGRMERARVVAGALWEKKTTL